MSQTTSSPTGARLEFERRDLGVGCFLVVALSLFLAVAGVALRDRLFVRTYPLSSSFARIEGLEVGAEVQLRGYTVGEVTRIHLVGDPEFRFDVDLKIAEGIRLPAGTRARLSFRGLGTKFLELVTPEDRVSTPGDGGPSQRPRVFLTAGAVLPGELGTDLDAILTDAQLAVRRFTGTLERVDRLLDEAVSPAVHDAGRLLREEVHTALGAAQIAIEQTQAMVAETRAAIAENRPRTSRVLDLAADDLVAGQELIERADAVLAELDKSVHTVVERLGASLEQADSLLGKVDGAIREEDLRATLVSLKEAAEEAQGLLEELHRRPWRLMRRVKGEKESLEEELKSKDPLPE